MPKVAQLGKPAVTFSAVCAGEAGGGLRIGSMSGSVAVVEVQVAPGPRRMKPTMLRHRADDEAAVDALHGARPREPLSPARTL